MSEEEEHDIEGQNELAKIVADLGLNKAYWIPKLRDVLEITNAKALQHFGPEEFDAIQTHCRQSWEKKALRALLETSGIARKLSQSDRSIGNKQTQDALQKQNADGMQPRQRLARSGEVGIENTVEQPMGARTKSITGNTSVKPPDLKDIAALRGTESHLRLLRHASEGLALDGVYKTGKAKDLLKKRGKLINVPTSFALTGPLHQPMTMQQYFPSTREEAIFEKAAVQVGFNTMTTEGDFVRAFNEETTSQISETLHAGGKEQDEPTDSYVHCVKYLYLPLASGNIAFHQLKLSEEALEALKGVEKTLQPAKDLCKTRVTTSRLGSFFETFGSHAHTGDVHFGGIFKWKASMEGIASDRTFEERNMLSEAVETYSKSADTSSGFAGGLRSMASESSERHNATLLSKVNFSMSTTGGPPGIYSLQQWKSEIVTNTKTWSVIDRGMALVPIWDIVTFNHQHDFKNTLIADSLKEAYTHLTNQNVDSFLEDLLESARTRARLVMEDIIRGEESDMEGNLQKMIDLKQKLQDETKSDLIWTNTCLSNPSVQSYLSKIVTAAAKSVTFTKLMRSLLDANVGGVESFPQLTHIMQSLNEAEAEAAKVSDFKDLMRVLKKAKEHFKEAEMSSNSPETYLQKSNYVTRSFNSCCQSLKRAKLIEEELLITSVASAVGYCVKENRFQRCLDCYKIEDLERALGSAYGEYSRLKDQDTSRAQAYVVQKCLSNARTPDEKQKQLDFARCHLEETMCAEVARVMKCSDQGRTDWKKLDTMLDAVVNGTLKDQRGCSNEPFRMQNTTTMSRLKNKDRLSSRKNQSHDEVHAQPQTNDRKEFMNLLKRLALVKYYPDKLQQSDVCVIDQSPKETTDTSTEGEIAFCYLQKLIMIDYRARCVRTQGEKRNEAKLNNLSQSMHKNDDSNVDAFFAEDDPINNIDVPGQSNETHIHPMDLQMAIFHCADNFLKQYMYTKLSFIQFALPLLISNPGSAEIKFPMWSFRKIQKSWKCRDESAPSITKQQSKNCAISDADTPLVSFIRFGESSTSKSQMLNSLLGKQKHGVFFNRHCRGSNGRGLLMKGVVEIAWYFPSGSNDDVFNECIAFTNLHGDARAHREQVRFLHEISSVNVILLSDLDRNATGNSILQDCLSSPKPLICLCADKKSVASGQSGTKVKIAVENRNEAELIDELTLTIKRFLKGSKSKVSIQTCSRVAKKYGFIVDEDDEDCIEGKSMAKDLLALIKEEPLSSIKEKFLPLQGKLWRSWCKNDKELMRMKIKGSQSVEQYRSGISEEKTRIRKAQQEKAFPLNDFMRLLIESLTHKTDTVKKYFLYWLQIHLDNLPADRLSQLHHEYHKAWTEITELKKRGSDKSDIATKQSELDKISEERDACSFGIDHVFREVGQIFEALHTKRTFNQLSATLANIAADMMISGFPIELRDGDAAYVPVVWIGSILDKIVAKIGDVKVFVLSILGIQSSGKSTLLNAMFGLQFPVGSGRCTQGAYMQLVRVKEEFTKELGYDYVLIVDTEGLRSVELSNATLTHDNELATFVIGLGSMTVINIFGENPSEMQDILQIAVQALLRMREVRLSPSCVFVHQNVGDVTAHDKNMEGKRRFQEKLDEMTRMAAEQEQCQTASFDEVIKFDMNSQICYFPHLWEGDPPMAPPNPSYCQNIQELKAMLLSNAKRGSSVKVLKMSELKARVKDLWRALLAENFVFSFKNTIEIAAYTKLEEMYGKWTWELRSHVVQQEHKLYNSIGNNADAVTRSQIEQRVLPKYEDIKKNMEKHFDDAEDAEMLVQWKVKFEKGFETVKEELVSDAYNNYRMLVTQKEKKRDLDEQRSKYEAELIGKSKDLASKLTNKNVTEDEWKTHFDELWENWIKDIKETMLTPTKVDIRRETENILYDVFNNQRQHLDENLKSGCTSKTFAVQKDQHVLMNSKCMIASKSCKVTDNHFEKEDDVSINNLINDVKFKVSEYITVQEKYSKNFTSSYIHEILAVIKEALNEFSQTNKRFRLKDKFKIDLSVHILVGATGRFEKMHNDFQRANDPLVYFDSKREEYFNTFKIRCKGATSTAIFVDSLSKKLKTSIQEAVYDKVSLDIAGRMKATFPAFNGNRSKLENYILVDLAKKKDFEAFQEYIHHPKQHFQKYIVERVEDYCSENGNTRIHGMLNSSLEEYTAQINRAIIRATESVKKNKYNSWLHEFCKQLDNIIDLPKYNLEQGECKETPDLDFLSEKLRAELTTVVQEIKQQFSSARINDLKNVKNKPHEILYQHLCGCWVQCPSCKAICTNTIAKHDGDHSVSFHRPQALRGGKWYKTDHFVIDICTSLVASDCSIVFPDRKIPWKNYRTAGPAYACWSITPDDDTLPYWKWFVCTFASDLEEYYSLKFLGKGKIPQEWESVKEREMLDILENQ